MNKCEEDLSIYEEEEEEEEWDDESCWDEERDVPPNWIKVSGSTKLPISHDDSDIVSKWCENNIKSDYIRFIWDFYFESEKDASFFMLRWL